MSDLNPYRDASPFGKMTIGGVAVAGVIQSINGAEKPEEWSFQKGTGSNSATSVWKGTKLAEGIEVVTALFDVASYQGHETLRRTLRPKIGTKPPSLPIENALVNAEGILVISCVVAPPAKWVKGGGYWLGTFKVAEYNPPKPAKTGQAGAPQAQQPNTGTPPKTAGEKELSEALDEAAKL
jgi:hypothetical protein